MKKLTIKKCSKCNALFEVLEDCKCETCEITCCGLPMKDLIPNTEEASHEKHIPVFTIEKDNINITVNHVMEEDHFIKWIKVITENEEITKNFKPNETINLTVPYQKEMTIYAYCNKHGLWEREV